MKRFLVLILICVVATLFLIVQAEPASAETYRVTAEWTKPTTNSDGSPLTDLEGFTLSYGGNSGAYTQDLNVGNVDTVTLDIVAEPGSHGHFAVLAFDTAGNKSDYSTEVTVPFALPVDFPPATPSGLKVQSQLLP